MMIKIIGVEFIFNGGSFVFSMNKSSIHRLPAGTLLLVIFTLILASCAGQSVQGTPTGIPVTGGAARAHPTATNPLLVTPTTCAGGECLPVYSPTEKRPAGLPKFSHVIVIVLENHEYNQVIGNQAEMPYLNQLAQQYTLLTNYHGVTHPSLPNYLAMIGGDTFGINSDCTRCSVNKPSLPDLLEASGKTWKTYQENMPSPCFSGAADNYAKRHNPFLYFEPIFQDQQRCQQHVVPFDQLDKDLLAGNLPDYAFITPNLCNDAHNCSLPNTDQWLKGVMDKLQKALFLDKNSLIAITFDEGNSNSSCCGLASPAGGKVATVLVSPLVKAGFQDDTPYSHYSLLKTIEDAWGLTELGQTASPETNLILAPWAK